MSQLIRFPFKSMIPIVNFLYKKGYNTETDVSMIQAASNACYPDTLEVLEMLYFLTSFGQVCHSTDGWFITHNRSFKDDKRFRDRFLIEVIEILTILTSEPKSILSLQQSLPEMDETTLLEFLYFLEKISSFGYIKKTTRGWNLSQHESVVENQA